MSTAKAETRAPSDLDYWRSRSAWPSPAGPVDFAPVERVQRTGRWEAAGQLLAAEACTLARAGAELLVLCTSTMHKVADHIAQAITLIQPRTDERQPDFVIVE